MPASKARLVSPFREVWAYLSQDEARDLLAALVVWDEDGGGDAECHHHIGGLPDGELTIAIQG